MNRINQYSDELRLKAVMQWLCRAQDATGSGGVSGGYVLKKGWKPPYPETTGYIIPTFIRYSELTNDGSYLERAVTMGNWELEIQLLSGGVRGGIGLKERPIVFDTGQVIIGWTSLFEKTKKEKYLHAAVRAADWLVKIQDSDGKWSRHTFFNVPHAYHSRVSWALLKLYGLTGTSIYLESAKRNISWILGNARDNGWIDFMGFTPQASPLTHTIAYTLRGLFESSDLVDSDMKDRIMPLLFKATDRLISAFHLDENLEKGPMTLPATINPRWKSWARYSCITGNAQFAILFLKIYSQNREAKYLKSGLNLIETVKTTQDLLSSDEGVSGAIPGSYPISGKYQKNTYPNWAAKFYADALMLGKGLSG
jgi:hypothetical protein